MIYVHRLYFSLIPLIFIAACATTNLPQSRVQSFQTLHRSTSYLIYLPVDYEHSEKHWPLLLFLHGAGSRGDDIELVKVFGPPKLVEQGQHFPFIIVSPQCPLYGRWSMNILNALLDEVIARYPVDEKRVYATGLSMGGYGTWNLAATFPDRFAAIAPICGGGNLRKASAMKHIPIWAFHGEKDKTVPTLESQMMVDKLKAVGGNVRFTVYPDTDHAGAWKKAYRDPQLYEWLLSHHK